MTRIVLFFSFCLVSLFAAFAIRWASLGYYQPAEHWIPEELLVKEHKAQSIKVPKLIIVSGSNALFGIDSHTLERFIGRPVVNLATHASPLAIYFILSSLSAGRCHRSPIC